jgi:hypothetical protein
MIWRETCHDPTDMEVDVIQGGRRVDRDHDLLDALRRGIRRRPMI